MAKRQLTLKASEAQKKMIGLVAGRMGITSETFILESASHCAEELLSQGGSFAGPLAVWKDYVRILQRRSSN